MWYNIINFKMEKKAKRQTPCISKNLIFMEKNYNIDEILKAFNDLQNLPKQKTAESSNNKMSVKKNTDIPSNTLKLILEAETINS